MPARKTNKELLRKEASNDLKGSNKTNRSIDKLTISVTEDSSPGKKKKKRKQQHKKIHHDSLQNKYFVPHGSFFLHFNSSFSFKTISSFLH